MQTPLPGGFLIRRPIFHYLTGSAVRREGDCHFLVGRHPPEGGMPVNALFRDDGGIRGHADHCVGAEPLDLHGTVVEPGNRQEKRAIRRCNRHVAEVVAMFYLITEWPWRA